MTIDIRRIEHRNLFSLQLPKDGYSLGYFDGITLDGRQKELGDRVASLF